MPKKDTYYGVEIAPAAREHIEEQLEEHRTAKKLERSNAGKVLRRFAKRVKAHGFKRKSTWFARETNHFVQFLHIHKYTFGPYFRLHYGVRVLNDDKAFVALNGPAESQGLEYGTDDHSLEQCAEALYALVKEDVEPWFETQTTENLLDADSCLYPAEREALRRALAGQVDEGAARRSRALFGLT